MRSTVNIRGDLEKYVRQESLRSGMTIPNVIVNLAVSGMEYKEALKEFFCSCFGASEHRKGGSKWEEN